MLILSSAKKLQGLRTSVLDENAASIFSAENAETENQCFGGERCFYLQPRRYRD
jgi:hypothetical protein